MKRVFIIHGWGGSPKEAWFVWLKKELEKRKYKVIVPTMPGTEHPKIQPWVSHLKKSVGKLDKDTFFVGHSIGCQTILRYVKRNKFGGAVFVAPWITLKGLSPDEVKIARPWLHLKIGKIKGKSVALFSDNDPVVPLSNTKSFKKMGKVIIQKNKGHFTSGDDKIKKIPVVLKELKRMMQ